MYYVAQIQLNFDNYIIDILSNVQQKAVERQS